jgi:hypothetical protein
MGSAALTGLTATSNFMTIGDNILLAGQGLSLETHNYELYNDINAIIDNENLQDIQSTVDTLGNANTGMDLAKMYAGYVTLRDMRAAFGDEWVSGALSHMGDSGFLTAKAKEAHNALYNTNVLVGVVNTILGSFSVNKAEQARTNYLNSIDYACINYIDGSLAEYKKKIKDGTIIEIELKNYFQYIKLREEIRANVYKNSADQAKNNMWGEFFNIKYPNFIYQGVDYIGNILTGQSTEDAIANLNYLSTESIKSANIIRASTFDHLIIQDDYSNFKRWLSSIEVSDTTPPIANAGFDQVVKINEIVFFDGSGSNDNVGITSYSWDFDDSDGIQGDANGTFSSHIYESSGTYTVTLTVNDGNGNGPKIDTLKVVVEPKNYDVTISPTTISKISNTSSTAIYELIIENTGDVDDIFRVGADRGILSRTSFPLEVGESASFIFQDSSLIEGTYVAKIIATSLSDPTKSSMATVTTIVTKT